MRLQFYAENRRDLKHGHLQKLFSILISFCFGALLPPHKMGLDISTEKYPLENSPVP